MIPFVELNKKSRNTLRFQNCCARKLIEEFKYRGNDIYIFRIPRKKFTGFLIYIKDEKIKDVV
jgi:hypothetical protein